MKKLLTNFLTLLIKCQISTVYYFSCTPFYLLYVSVVMLSLFNNHAGSLLSSACKFVLVHSLLSAFLLFFLLNIDFLRERVYFLVGKNFIDSKKPAIIKTPLPFLFFLFTISVVGCIEVQSWYLRVESEAEIFRMERRQVDNLKYLPTCDKTMDTLEDILHHFSTAPKSFSKTGIVTDFSTFICSKL